jgi:peptidoglycan/xylan/chitin deacetylase (PgdA/CDA1 family)
MPAMTPQFDAAGLPPFAPPRTHGRFAYSAIVHRPDYRWGNGARLAVYIGCNVEHFAFGEGMGARLADPYGACDVLNYSWREYGNRVGVWRCLEEFDRLALPTAAIVNTALFDHAPSIVAAFVARGDEIVAHGHTNAEQQGEFPEARERALLAHCRERILRETGTAPRGWLSPWIAESALTPDLLAEEGYGYTLNWAHDDQPTRLATRAGGSLWSIPYPQELNDIPMIVGRKLDAPAFARMIVDQFDEMLAQSNRMPLVMGIALHPYLVGQPYRLRALRAALEHIARARDAGRIEVATPGVLCAHVDALAGAAP